MEWQGVASNPFAKTTKFKHERKKQYTPRPEDIQILLSSLDKNEYVFIDTYLNTGARRDEVFRLKWNEAVCCIVYSSIWKSLHKRNQHIIRTSIHNNYRMLYLSIRRGSEGNRFNTRRNKRRTKRKEVNLNLS